MARKDPKTRFVCDTPDGPKQLFSVREEKDGELRIGLHNGSAYTADQLFPNAPEIKGSKISVHRSNDGFDTTIKHTTLLSGSEVLDTCAFVNGPSQKLIWPVYATYCSDMSAPAFALDASAKDTVVTVARTGQKPVTLFYGLAVSSSAINPRFPWRFPQTVITFEHFKVLVVCAYLAYPPMRQAKTQHFMTNSPRKNFQFVHGDISERAHMDTFSPALLKNTLKESFAILRRQFETDARELLAREDAQLLARMDEFLLPLLKAHAP